jgi:hypothetical protein
MTCLGNARGKRSDTCLGNACLIGATSVGLTEHVGVLRGLIQTRTRLTPQWKAKLSRDPHKFPVRKPQHDRFGPDHQLPVQIRR